MPWSHFLAKFRRRMEEKAPAKNEHIQLRKWKATLEEKNPTNR